MGIKKVLNKIIGCLDLNKHVISTPSNLIEYDLLNFNEDLDKAWEKIKALYDKVLYKDNYWHLFYEGDFSTLRCSPEYSNEVEEFFYKYNMNYKYNGTWVDGSSTVEKYKNIFRNMFHTFSELAIHMDEEDLFHVADRVCHSFFNHAFYMAKKHRKLFEESGYDSPSSMMWEAEIMSRILIYRAHYIGKYDMSKYYKKLEKESNKDKSNDIDNTNDE